MKQLCNIVKILLLVLTFGLVPIQETQAAEKDAFLDAGNMFYDNTADTVYAILKNEYIFVTSSGKKYYNTKANGVVSAAFWADDEDALLNGVGSDADAKTYVKNNLAAMAREGNTKGVNIDFNFNGDSTVLVFDVSGNYIGSYDYSKLVKKVSSFDVTSELNLEIKKEKVSDTKMKLYLEWDFYNVVPILQDSIMDIKFSRDGNYDIVSDPLDYFPAIKELLDLDDIPKEDNEQLNDENDHYWKEYRLGKSNAFTITQNGTYKFEITTWNGYNMERSIKITELKTGGGASTKYKATKEGTTPKVTFSKLKKVDSGVTQTLTLSVNRKCRITFNGQTLKGYKKSGKFDVSTNGTYAYTVVAKDGAVKRGTLTVDSFKEAKSTTIRMADLQGDGKFAANRTTLAQSGDTGGTNWLSIVLLIVFIASMGVFAYSNRELISKGVSKWRGSQGRK